jgi:threonine dehydratase
MMAKLSQEQLEKGVICSSAGNHAQGVALSAKELGCDAVIVMPVTTPEIKVISLPVPLPLICYSVWYIYIVVTS